MNNLRKTIFVSLAGLFVFAHAADDTITLKRTFTEGETDTYDMATSSDNTIDLSAFGQGSQAMKTDMSGKITYKTLKVNAEKGEATVEAKFHDIDMKMDGPVPQTDTPKEYTVTGTMDSRNRFKDIKVEGLPMMMRMTMESSIKQMASGFQFPEAPVKVGDTWDMVIPKDGKTFTKDQILKTKLVSTKVVDGKTIAELEVAGDIELDIDTSKLGDAGAEQSPMGNMMIKGKIHSKSIIRVDVASGKLNYMESDSTTDMNIEMSQGKLPMSGTGKTIIKRAKS